MNHISSRGRRTEDRRKDCLHREQLCTHPLNQVVVTGELKCMSCVCRLCFIDDLATLVMSDEHTKCMDPCVWRLFIIKVMPGYEFPRRNDKTGGEGVKIWMYVGSYVEAYFLFAYAHLCLWLGLPGFTTHILHRNWCRSNMMATDLWWLSGTWFVHLHTWTHAFLTKVCWSTA